MRLFLSVLVLGLLSVGLVSSQSSSSVGVVSGVVVGRSGVPVPAATVELIQGDQVVHTTATDASGAFRFEHVAPGAYQVRVVAPRLGVTVRPVTVGSDLVPELRLVVPDPAIATNEQKRQEDSDVGSRSFSTVSVVGGIAAAPPMPPGLLPGGFNTEAYASIVENGFHRVTDDPLSTFSIDVDTASYANVRRFLNGGTLPPVDAVRVEELINYFRFDYAEPRGDVPFSVTTDLGPCPWAPTHRLALVGLRARSLSQERTPPRNLVFLLDVSGSMSSPDKLPLVRTAMRMLADTLRPEDRVAIVVYAGASGLVLPSTPGSRKAEIQEAIARLTPGGSTNGAAGIQLAYDIASQAFVKGGINRVILATDGDFNVGVTSEGELTRLIEEKRERGVFLSVLGVGTGNLKDSTMEQLADKGNGNYSYLDSLHEARRVLIAEAGSTLVTVAKDVKIQIEFNPARVGAYRLIGYENRLLENQDFNDDRKDAGEIGAGHTVTALYEIVPPGEDVGGPGVDPLKYQTPARPAAGDASGEVMTVKLRYKAPDGETSQLVATPVRDRDAELTGNLGFAAAVAEFGMLLRGSDRAGTASWDDARDLARRFRGADPDGYRAEFIRLIDLASALEAQGAMSPQRHQ